MSTSILDHLQVLRPHSEIRLVNDLSRSFKTRIHNSSGARPVELIKAKMISSTDYTSELYMDSQSLLQAKNRQAIRKVLTLQPSFGGNLTYRLNTALLGGESHPILTALLGTAVGLTGLGAGLIFATATTAISTSDRSQRVLARGGDEIWQVEEIGKVRDGSKYMAMHINSYFLVDPFRNQSLEKGWLIHEEREEITLN